MAKTAAKDQIKTETPQSAPASQLPAPLTMHLRLAYPKSAGDTFGISQSDWIVLTDVIFPNATSAASVLLALRYCKARHLDVMKKVINIVPMYSKALGKMVDTIWPGIAEVRITATRTGVYAGRDAEVYGDYIDKLYTKGKDKDGAPISAVISVPEWCQLTVYKIVQGQRCAFVGPRVYWEEAYATAGRDTDAPNEMWQDRKHGQLSKCTEAASLRGAFPEETGGMVTAEEMHGRVIDGDINTDTMVVQDDTIVPPRPQQSDFARNPDKPKNPAKDGPQAQTAGNEPDGRPEPPPLGEPVQDQPQGPQKPKPINGATTSDMPDLPESLRRQPVAEVEPEIQDEESDDDEAPTEAYMSAMNLLDQLESTMPNVADLDVFKKEGRANIDKEPGMTDDERDMLRGRFTTMCLTEQKRRAKR